MWNNEINKLQNLLDEWYPSTPPIVSAKNDYIEISINGEIFPYSSPEDAIKATKKRLYAQYKARLAELENIQVSFIGGIKGEKQDYKQSLSFNAVFDPFYYYLTEKEKDLPLVDYLPKWALERLSPELQTIGDLLRYCILNESKEALKHLDSLSWKIHRKIDYSNEKDIYKIPVGEMLSGRLVHLVYRTGAQNMGGAVEVARLGEKTFSEIDMAGPKTYQQLISELRKRALF